MSDYATIYRGGNRLFTLAITDENATALPRSSLASAYIELWQKSSLVATYTYGTNNEFRAGSGANEFTLELTSAVTLNLAPRGVLTAKLYLSVTDSDFEVEPDAFKDVIETVLAEIA